MMGPACPCLDALAPASQFERTFLGADDLYGEASVAHCKTCGRDWLHYCLTYEAFTGSGRWFRGQVGAGADLSPRNVLLVLSHLPGYFAGGSFYGGQAHRRSGPAETREAPSAGPAFRALPLDRPMPASPGLPPALRDFAAEQDDGDPQFEPHVAACPDGTRWAFTTRRVEDGLSSVWVDRRLVTEIPGSAVHPCPFWSPDGRQLGLFVVHLEQERSAMILLPDLRGEGEIVYESALVDFPESPAWSPSGRSIAFLRTRAPRHEFTRTGEPEVTILDVATGEHFPACGAGEALGPLRWADARTLDVGGSPTGRRLEFFVPV